MSDFVKLTRAPDGAPLYVKKEMVAVVTPFRGVTHVVLTNEDVDYEVKETPEQVLRKLEGDENCEMSPLTVQTNCDKLSDRKDRQCKHHKFRRGSELVASPSSQKPDSRPRSPESVVAPTDADATAGMKS